MMSVIILEPGQFMLAASLLSVFCSMVRENLGNFSALDLYQQISYHKGSRAHNLGS